MEPKKNPDLDLNKNSSLYFVIGLTIVLFSTWLLLEHKSYESTAQYDEVLNVEEVIKEEIPITKQVRTTPPPPPPSAPAVIEIFEDEIEIEETIIESTESSQDLIVDDAILSVDDISMEEEEEDITVPFAVIENVPVFPGCENCTTEKERKDCFNRMVQEHIKKNLRYPQTALDMGITGRVYLQFHIDKHGKVTNLRKRGPDKLLENEAERIIAALPQMKPGMQRGQPAQVGYSIPINFMMQ